MSDSKTSIDHLDVKRTKNRVGKTEWHLCTIHGESVVEYLFDEALANRLAARWNACKDMKDPVSEVQALREQIDEWKSASMLSVGGDPDGVTPEILRREVQSLREACQTGLAMIKAMSPDTEMNVGAGVLLVTFRNAARAALGDDQ